jgi:hypothetical protein
LHLARQRQPLRRHRQRKVQYSRGLRSLKGKPVAAMVAAKQASGPATPLGLDVARRRGLGLLSRQRAETHSPTRPTWSARKPKRSWAWTKEKPGGFVPACSTGGSLPGRRTIRSPRDQDVGSSPYCLLAVLSNVRAGCAPSNGGAFQWAQIPLGNRSSAGRPSLSNSPRSRGENEPAS